MTIDWLGRRGSLGNHKHVPTDIVSPTTGEAESEVGPHAHTITVPVMFLIDGGGSEISDGIKGDIMVPFAGTITDCVLLADQTGQITVDLWNDTYANFPPTDADSITASATPTVSGATKSIDSTLTGWDTAIAAGDVIRVNVDSCTTVQRCTLVLYVTREV